MEKRSIRLKEHTPLTFGEHTPSDDYMEGTNGSLKQRPYKWSADSQGFLETGAALGNGRSLYALGGSFIESMYADPDKRFLSLLSQKLPLNIFNAGYSGMTSLQMLLLLQAKIIPLSNPGDIVVISGSKSDVNALLSRGGYWGESKRITPVLPKLSNNVRDVIDVQSEAYKILRLAVETCKVYQLIPYMMVTPHYEGDFSSDTFLRKKFKRDRGLYKKNIVAARELDDVVKQVSRSNGCGLIDIQGGLNNVPDYLYDLWHLNEAGQYKAAEIMLSVLLPIYER